MGARALFAEVRQQQLQADPRYGKTSEIVVPTVRDGLLGTAVL